MVHHLIRVFEADGELAAARLVAKLGTKAEVARELCCSDSNQPGIGAERVLLGCAQPGETLATFSDALRRLSDEGQNIHQDGNRYWVSSKPNLNRTVEAIAFSRRFHVRDGRAISVPSSNSSPSTPSRASDASSQGRSRSRSFFGDL